MADALLEVRVSLERARDRINGAILVIDALLAAEEPRKPEPVPATPGLINPFSGKYEQRAARWGGPSLCPICEGERRRFVEAWTKAVVSESSPPLRMEPEE